MGTVACALAALLLAACSRVPLDEMDEIYWRPGDDRRVLCAAGLDEVSGNDLDSVLGGLRRAQARGEVIGLFTHAPGRTVSWARLEAVLAEAQALELDFLSYAELEQATPGRGGVLLGFDDDDVTSWLAARPMLAQYGARVTFFVTRFDLLTAEERAGLHQLAADGHAIEAHGLRHLRAPDYVSEHGLAAYLAGEALPSIELLRADGFAPTVFAYPFGARTGELDRALLEHVTRLRAVSFSLDGLVADPCPE